MKEQRPYKVTNEIRSQIVSLRRQGKTLREIADVFNISRYSVSNAITRTKIKAKYGKIGDKEKEHICQEYKAGKTILEIYRESGRSRGTVRKILKESDIERRPRSYYRGEKHTAWRGGRFIAKNTGYVWIAKPGYSRSGRKGYVMEHRYVMEQYLGRPLKTYEQIHHKNGIKTDNRIENLEVVMRDNHRGAVTCPFCLREFSLQ